MSLSTKPYKGTRDFYPEDYRLQKYIFSVWAQSVESFGYEQYNAPLLEPKELYLAKTGDEIINEQTYEFVDRGGRNVVIRPEMTPTVARMVAAKRQELPYPLRWYSMPNLWRYERPQRGRLREHWQLNVDLFGVDNLQAEIEIITLADDIMQRFGAKRSMYGIKLSSRKLTNFFLHEVIGLDETQSHSMIKLIDRMHKIDSATFAGLLDGILHPAQREAGKAAELNSYLNAKNIHDVPESIKQQEDYIKLRALIADLHNQGLNNSQFDTTLMRGFDYYTDIVFEMFDTSPENNRAMFGGGRYDALVSLFGVDPVPTIGFGMGDVVIADFLHTHNLLPKLEPSTELYVVPIGDTVAKINHITTSLRDEDVRVAVDISGKKVDKQIKAANKHGVRYVMFIGEEEIKQEQFSLKNLRTGAEEKHSLERIISIIKDTRK